MLESITFTYITVIFNLEITLSPFLFFLRLSSLFEVDYIFQSHSWVLTCVKAQLSSDSEWVTLALASECRALRARSTPSSALSRSDNSVLTRVSGCDAQQSSPKSPPLQPSIPGTYIIIPRTTSCSHLTRRRSVLVQAAARHHDLLWSEMRAHHRDRAGRPDRLAGRDSHPCGQHVHCKHRAHGKSSSFYINIRRTCICRSSRKAYTVHDEVAVEKYSE